MYLRATRRGLGQAPEVRIRPDTITPAAARLDQFAHNSATPTDDHRSTIDRIAARIASSWRTGPPLVTVKVVGHTDTTGTPNYNQVLGLRRALAVRKELQRALEKQQRHLSFKVLVLASSKGSRERIDVSDTPEGRGRNRRVEVFLSTKALMPIRKKQPKDKPPDLLPLDPGITTPRLPIQEDRCDPGEFERRRRECQKQFATSALSRCGGLGYLTWLLRTAKAAKCLRHLVPGVGRGPGAALACAIPVATKEYVAQLIQMKQCIDGYGAELTKCIQSARQFTNCPR